jgi:ribosomal protein L14
MGKNCDAILVAQQRFNRRADGSVIIYDKDTCHVETLKPLKAAQNQRAPRRRSTGLND